MRENRTYGSEGGEALTGLPYPYLAVPLPTSKELRYNAGVFGCYLTFSLRTAS